MARRVKRASQATAKTESNTDAGSARHSVASINRAIDILLSFKPGESELTLATLSERTGFYKSTILRILATLEDRNFITRFAHGGYRLGPALLHLGTTYQKAFRLEDIVTPQLAQLTEITGESASFFVSDGNFRLCLFRTEPPQIVRHTVEVGESLPMGRGASGKVLTTFSDGANRTAREAFTQIPIESIGSNPLDISTIAGPVFNIKGDLVGAVSISGPSSRFDTRALRRAKRTLIDALKALTTKLGGNSSVYLG